MQQVAVGRRTTSSGRSRPREQVTKSPFVLDTQAGSARCQSLPEADPPRHKVGEVCRSGMSSRSAWTVRVGLPGHPATIRSCGTQLTKHRHRARTSTSSTANAGDLTKECADYEARIVEAGASTSSWAASAGTATSPSTSPSRRSTRARASNPDAGHDQVNARFFGGATPRTEDRADGRRGHSAVGPRC